MKTPTFPFTHESVQEELCDRRLTLARNIKGNSYYRRMGSLTLTHPGDWDVDGGALLVLDQKDRVLHRLDGLEAGYGGCRIVGEDVTSASSKGFARVAIWPYEPLGTDFSVAVSSHVDYHEQTMPRLLKSLARAGVESGDVEVVVCGARKDPREEERDGVRFVFVPWDMQGFAGLAAEGKGNKYVLLLHDTCSVDEGFAERVMAVDVGVPHDIILASNDNEIGLYSSWLTGQLSLEDAKPKGFMKRLRQIARSWSVMEGARRSLGEKDVYGGGVKREVVAYDGLGVRKFFGVSESGGRP